MNRLTSAISQALGAVSVCGIIMACLVMLVSCGEQQQYVQQGPHWYQEGPIEYRFPNAYQCIVRIHSAEYNIPRHQEEGGVGELEWKWEDDGDIDIEYLGQDYDLDSPYDYNEEEFDGYEDIGGGFVMVWLGGKLVKKPKSFLKINPKYNKVYKRTSVKTVNRKKVVQKTKTTVNTKTGQVTTVKSTIVAKIPVKKKKVYKKKTKSKKKR